MFEPAHISTFMGGKFTLPDIKTVADLRVALREWLNEVETWGEGDQQISECAIVKGGMEVTLREGIVQ